MAKVKVRGASVQKDLQAIINVVAQEADGIRTVTFNTVKGQLARRIFNNGTATAGQSIGQYQPLTKKIREAGGRQTSKVDLEMTGTLRRSVAVGVGEQRVVLGLLEQPEPEIKIENGRVKISGTSDFSTVENAILQEKHFNTEIFAPSKEEVNRGEKTLIKILNKQVQKALGRS